MPTIDDLTAIRRLLDVPAPTGQVTAAGRARLDELTHHESSRRRRPIRTSGGTSRPRSHRIGVLVTMASVLAASAVAATTLVLIHPRSAQPSAAQRVGTQGTGAAATAPGSVKLAILTAIGSVSGDIMHLTVSTSGGSPVARGVDQYWWWPAKPAPGQQVHLLFVGISTREDVTFTEPAPSPGNPKLRMIPASGFFTDPASKTWQPISQFAYEGVFAETSGSLLDESYMRSTYLARGKVINDHTAIDGRISIEISTPGVPGLQVLLWVDAQTYLPLRQVKLDSMATNNPETKTIYEYQFLPATAANLAKLTLTLPSGYAKASS
jgi:hypothetical protein